MKGNTGDRCVPLRVMYSVCDLQKTAPLLQITSVCSGRLIDRVRAKAGMRRLLRLHVSKPHWSVFSTGVAGVTQNTTKLKHNHAKQNQGPDSKPTANMTAPKAHLHTTSTLLLLLGSDS